MPLLICSGQVYALGDGHGGETRHHGGSSAAPLKQQSGNIMQGALTCTRSMLGFCQGLFDLDHCDTIRFLAAVPLRLLAGKGPGVAAQTQLHAWVRM